MASSSQASAASTLPAGFDATLRLGDGVELTLEDDTLRILEMDAGQQEQCQKKLRLGYGRSRPREWSIPYYDILWAEFTPDDDSDELTIDYARGETKTRVRPERLRFAVHAPSKQDDVASPAVAYEWVKTLMDRAYGRAMRRKRAFVLINPHSGQGVAVRKWEQKARPLFERARMELSVVHTARQGHATDLVKELDIDKFDILIVCSGDGVVYEVFNGLAARPDAGRAFNKLAVCHVPCGSGNAMACNVYGTHHSSLAALAIVKGVTTPVDLVSVTQGDRRTVSFLSQAVGIIAEADLGTEWLRFLGALRFTLGVLLGFFRQKVYPCDIAVQVDVGTKPEIRHHYRANHKDCSVGPGDRSDSSSEPAGGDASGSGSGDGAAAASSSPSSATTAKDEGLPPLRFGTVNDPLPAGWELLPHPKMGNFYCGNMPYMQPGSPFFQASLINDGLMDLVYMDATHGFFKYLEMFTSVDNGTFFDHPLVSYRKISAFRLIPHQTDGYISIDGERVPFQPFQAEVHRGLGTVLTRRGMFEASGPPGLPGASAPEQEALLERPRP